MAARVVLLASGSGSLAQAIIDSEELDIEIVALISDCLLYTSPSPRD